MGPVLNRGAQADARGATQVFGRFGQAVTRASCLSQVLDRGAEAAARVSEVGSLFVRGA